MRHRAVLLVITIATLATVVAAGPAGAPALADRAASGQSRLVVFEFIERLD